MTGKKWNKKAKRQKNQQIKMIRYLNEPPLIAFDNVTFENIKYSKLKQNRNYL